MNKLKLKTTLAESITKLKQTHFVSCIFEKIRELKSKTFNRKRGNHLHLGSWGERTASRYLRSHGYLVWFMNWRCYSGEIDIIAQESDTLVFIEVKTRSNSSAKQFSPVEAVDCEKQKRIQNCAAIFVSQKSRLLKQRRIKHIRFDIIALIPRQPIQSKLVWSLRSPVLKQYKNVFT